MRARVLSAGLVVVAFACGGSPGSGSSGFAGVDGGSSSGGGSSGGGSGGLSSSSGGVLGNLDGGSSGGDAGSSCTGQAADFVYVLSSEDDLYSFAPAKKVFTKIGHLGCQTSMKPNSMAVDRNANAWVNYVGTGVGGDDSGAIYEVSTKDASCASSPAVKLPNGWYRIGMGFSTISSSSTAEVLYVDGVGNGTGSGPTTGLGLADTGQGTVAPIGKFTGMVAGKPCELTGTGDGRLFGFFTTTPVYVAQIDVMNGSTPTAVPMTGLKKPDDWAFSFWGGHFYLYTSQGKGSTVTDYNPANGSIDLSYITDLSFNIVGAGVSTCAPTTMPTQ